jgi:hypothetical protein
VHANLRGGLHAVPPFDRLQVNHGDTSVRIALAARLYTGLASNTPRIVNEEICIRQRIPPA